MLLPLIALAAALQVAPDAQSVPANVASVTITPDNVDLDGTGKFDFTPDVAALNAQAGGGSLSFSVRLWLDATGKPTTCEPGRSPWTQAMQTACAELVKSASLHIMPGMVAPLRRGFVDVEFSLEQNPAQPGGSDVFAFDTPGYRNVQIVYPPDQIPDAEKLNATDGKLAITISAGDYPPMAIRYSLESVSAVQLGVSRDGVVKSCRPISNTAPRTAFLDNHSCALFLRRGHFTFAPGAASYEGLRYTDGRIRWVLPSE